MKEGYIQQCFITFNYLQRLTKVSNKVLKRAFILAVFLSIFSVVYFYELVFKDCTDSKGFQKVYQPKQSKNDFIDIGKWLQNQTLRGQGNVSNSKKVVVIYNPQKWFPVPSANDALKECAFNNCVLSTDRNLTKQADAVIFHLPVDSRKPPIQRKDRNTDQPWIAMYFESPVHIELKHLVNDLWAYSFNWSMSYKFDADISAPYGALKLKREETQKNYSAIFFRKKRMAAWVVSNCNTESNREGLVKNLKKNGVRVDIFGNCGSGRIDNVEIINNYKFYLAFENSVCEDYITEKFFDRYNFDIILVTYGGADYKNLLPRGSFVNFADFDSVPQLALYLQRLSNDHEMYTTYLKEKDKFEAIGPHAVRFQYAFCKMCAKLNNINENRNIIKHIGAVVNDSDCVSRRNNRW